MSELRYTPLYSDPLLVEYYQLEDLTGKNGNTLTNVDSVTFTPAKYNNGANFGASNSSKKLTAGNLGWDSTSNTTVVAWVKLLSEISSGTYDFVGLETTAGPSGYFFFHYEYNGGTRRLGVDFKGTSTTYDIALGTSNMYHIAFTRSGSTITLYLNGLVVATGSVGSGSSTDNALSIGGPRAGGAWSSSLMDEVAIFHKALTIGEVNMLYQDATAAFLFNMI